MATYTSNYNLYKPDTTDPTEDFVAEFGNNMDIIDENLGGGGGGGGHVILNPSGTSMAQEPSLQFAGKVGVSDDSTNTKTVVNVPEEIREVTQAQYEALPDTKLTDGVAYFIKDIDDDAVEGYPPLIYSSDEREVGIWKDGKPLYQRTIEYSCADNSNVQTAYLMANEVVVVHIADAYFQNSTGGLNQQFRYTWYKDHFWSYIVNNSGHVISVHRETTDANWQSGVKFIATIQYTKTTDVAGSGTWNGQGGLSVHYSTTEKVIGTWIDGKPVYEILINLNGLSVDRDAWVNTNISLSDYNIKGFVEQGELYQIYNGFLQVFPCAIGGMTNNTYIGVDTKWDGNTNARNFDYLRIRYTKTTD